MKRIILANLVLAAAALVGAAEQDRCTFDFKAASKAIYESGEGERNFVTNPNFREKEDPKKATSWRRTNTYVHCKDMPAEKAKEVRQQIEQMVQISFDDGMASVKVPTKAVDLIGGRESACWLHAYVGKLVMLDSATGGPYRITLRYRSNHDYGHENNYAYVFTQPVHVGDASGKGKKNVGKWMCKDFRDTGEDSDYVNFWSHDVEIPAGANAVEFSIRFMGAGYLKFTDFQLTERSAVANARPDVKFMMMPYGMADNTFAIESGDVGAVAVGWNCSKTAKLDWWKSWAEVVVPKDFEFVGANMADLSGRRKIERTKRPDGSERIRMPLGNRINPYVGERFHVSEGMTLLLRAKGPAGTKATLAYRVIGSDGSPLKDAGSCTLETIEPFSVVQPKRYRVGAMLTYSMQLFRSGNGANEAYADYLRSKGVTWIMPQTTWLLEDKTLLPMWRDKGFDLITPTDHDYLMNGYNVKGTGTRPKEDAFVPKPGLDPRLGQAACPASIYEERPYFVTNIVPNLAARSAGTDGQWVNWEPFFFKGCYCDYCKKLGAEWMEKTGDKNIEHFHSWQHGQIVKTVHKWMKKTFSSAAHHSSLVPRHSDVVGLMPAISWSEMSTQCRKEGYPQDKLSSDFADEIDWIPAWGPYVGWAPWEGGSYGGPYGIQRGKSLIVFFAAKDVREETDRFFKVEKTGGGGGKGRPKLMGQPAGANWLIQPEWLEISCDSYFFNRWEAIAPWVFPQGADARHWRAYGNSVNRAAKYEDAVWDGVRNDAATTLVAKPGFDFRCGTLDNFSFPGMTNVPFLQQTTYDYNGARYVACFNFDDESHSEFTLKTTGLSDGDYQVFGEDGKPLLGGKAFSAKTLSEKGVALSLPVSACRVFTLKPVVADRCAFDLPAVSRAIFEKDDSANPELAKDPLGFKKNTPKIWTPEAKDDLPCEVPEVVSSMVAERDGNLYSMKTPESLIGVVGKQKAEWLHDFATLRVELPDDKGGDYVGKFLYRANHVLGNAHNGCYLILRDGTKELGRLNAPDTGADSDYWRSRSRTFKIPAGVKTIECDFRLDGIAYFKFSGFSFKRAIEEVVPDVSFYVKPFDALDRRFAIEAGDVGAVELNWKRREGYTLEWWKDALELVVPRGFVLEGINMKDEKRPIVRTRRPDGSEVILAPMSRRISPQSPHYTYNNGQALGLLIRSTGPAGSAGTLRYRAVDKDGRTIGEAGSLTLFAIEPYRAVEPKRYLAGMMMTYDLQFFRDNPAANAAYADSLRKMGIRWIMPQSDWMVEDPTLVPMWRSKGFDYITSTDHDYLMNAYKIKGSCRRPPEEDFVKRPDIAMDWAFKEGRSSCPAAIYEERPFFVTNIVPNLAKRSAGADGQWVNWEPFYFRGCYCDYCKKLGKEWMEKTGDKNIEHFHSWQHGQLVKTVHKWMKKTFNSAARHSSLVTRHSDVVGLMPAISWNEMCSHARKVGYPEDKLSADFADEIDWIPAWGPYAGWAPWENGSYGGPYNPMAPRLLQVFFAAKDVREETDRFFKSGKRPKLMGQPAGANWAIQPEWLETACDAFFFNRWEAIAPWVYPQGADARHAQAYARSITRAARYEDAVWDGVRNDAATTLTYRPGFEVAADCFDKTNFPEMKDTPYIQQTTYDYKGARYVACFNFYDERHAEFTLRTKGLPAGDYQVVCEDGKVACPRVTAADLAEKGVALTLPVSACRVFTFKPVR